MKRIIIFILIAILIIPSFAVAEEIVAMHRLYNPNSGEHFYTASVSEKNHLVSVGWNYEGIGWYAPKKSKTPVYRLYNPNAGDHHYTMNKGERDGLIKLGWNDEGIAWYSDDQKRVPLYRQYNPNAIAGSHNYTTNKKENDWLVGLGWHEEGIGWYGAMTADEHKHKWVDVTGEQKVKVKDAWDEDVEKIEQMDVLKCKCGCGEVFDTEPEWFEHSEMKLNDYLNGKISFEEEEKCSHWADYWTKENKTVIVTIHHDAEYETKTVVIGQKCSECGEKK